MRSKSSQLDVTWKEAITEFIVPLLESVLPDLAVSLDPNREICFLDKELHELALTLKHDEQTTKLRRLEVDVLVELPLCGAPDVWLLLHIEVQGGGGKRDINRRMYEYHQLIEAKYNKHVAGLLIATEPLKTSGKLGKYEWRGYETVVIYKFKVIKTYDLDEAHLVASDNPFDLMQLAALRAWRARKNEQEKLEYAKDFVQLLRERNYSEAKIKRLMVFMERVIRIRDDSIEYEYIAYVDELEKKGEIPMQMLLNEIHALKQARERGRKQGLGRGFKIGKLEGELKGELKGKLETAAGLKIIGMDVETIVRVTGLTREQVESAG
ncbi:MAG: hypothetical protein ACRC46_03255 [Thermoguttaceae bacterium]